MMLLRRIVPLLAPVVVWALLTAVFNERPWFWPLLALAALFAMGTVLFLVHGRSESRDSAHTILVVLLFLLSSTAFLLFLPVGWFTQAFIVLIALFIGWYLENLFLFWYQTHRYQPNALEHIGSYLHLLTVFMSFSSLFALRVFVNVSFLLLLPAGMLLVTLLVAQSFWMQKSSIVQGRFLFLTQVLVLAELMGALGYLPTTFYVSGLLLTVPYYLMTNLARHHVRGHLDRNVLLRYTVIGAAVLTLTFLTAPWT